ncbi:MAG: GNAT family N-acetyltransferase, partial [Polyangiales bacterium]
MIRRIEPRDDAAVASIIRTVMPEFGAVGPGFAINDPEVDCMSATYSVEGSAYFVIDEGEVLGGGGIALLSGSTDGTCELRKMYFLPETRGRGLGAAMLETCLGEAKRLGYRRCYLETLTGMDAAQKLYRKFGFEPLPGPLGCTGHF